MCLIRKIDGVEVHPNVTQYLFGDPHGDHFRIEKTDWGKDLWAIRKNGYCHNSNRKWEYEPNPSSRTEDYLSRTRFSLEDCFRLMSFEIAGIPVIDQFET